MATINALQTKLNELYSFLCHPKETQSNRLESYFNNIKIGSILAQNDESPKLIIYNFAKAKNQSSILVLCEREGHMCEREGFMPWLIVEITFNNGVFNHYKLASYFENHEATQAFCIIQS